MNELQQVLLIFAVVVIAALYFLSRSRQAKHTQENDSQTAEPANQAKVEATKPIQHTISTDGVETEDVTINPQKKRASEALNDLGSPHIPLSASTEQRLTQTDEKKDEVNDATSQQKPFDSVPQENNPELHAVESSSSEKVNSKGVDQSQSPEPTVTENLNAHPNQGQLFFGEEFDVPHSQSTSRQLNDPEAITSTNETTEHPENNPITANTANAADSIAETANNTEASAEETRKPKHHVLVVDDPGMTGEMLAEQMPAEEVKPDFGIPKSSVETKSAVQASTDKKPEVFVLLVMSTGQEFSMVEVNQALYGVGLKINEQSIFVKKDNMGNEFIKVANMLEPGTFPVENLDQFNTPGVAMILELPTTVRAPAAMHDLIMMARKVSQRLHGRLYNMERQLIKESDLQSMRDAALDYESEPL